MSYIFKKGSKYCITFSWKGKRSTKSLRVSSKADAIKKQRAIDYDLAMGTFHMSKHFGHTLIDPDAVYLLQLAEPYKQHIENLPQSYKPETKAAYFYTLDVLINAVGEDIPISEINRKYVATKLRPYLETTFPSIATVRHHMVNLRSVFSYAVTEEFIPSNPFSGMVPKVPPKPPVLFRDEEDERIREYFQKADIPFWQQIYFPLLQETGLRESAQLALTWSENVFEKYLRFPGKGRFAGKWRVVPLTERAKGVLAKARAEKPEDEDRVFYQITSRNTVYQAWRKIRKDLDLSYTVHNFRSNRASRHVKSGMDVYKLMYIMGWEDYNSAKPYLVYSPDFLDMGIDIEV
jgi:integrase